MINQQLLNPKSIVVIGGSNNEQKPGGAIVRNLKQGGFKGDLYVLNPKEDVVQGIQAHHDMKDLPNADLAILVVAAKYCPEYVDYLTENKGVRAFIIISAGFGEETHEGALLEQHILDTCEKYGAALIGPNCIGLLTTNHHSVFTLPIPALMGDVNGDGRLHQRLGRHRRVHHRLGCEQGPAVQQRVVNR